MTGIGQPQQPSPFAVFRKRNFTLLWIGQFVSTIGNALTSLAAGILIFRLTGSALSVGLMLMVTAIPTIFVGLIAGVIVDRYDRRRIMIASEFIRAVLIGLIPLLVGFDIIWLYVIVLIASAINPFYDSAHESVLPEVASDEELAAANSMMAISSFGSTAIGFAAAGLIASQISIEWAFYIDAITFVISGFCILLVRLSKNATEEETTIAAIVENLRTGASFLYGHPVLRSLLITGVLVGFSFGMWNVLLLPFAINALGANEFEYGLQEALTSVGFVAGSFAMAKLAERLREGQWLAISLLSMGAIGVAYALTTSIPLAIGLVMLSGFLNAPYSIARQLLFQRNTPRELRGRVSSSFIVVRDVIFLVGMGAAGLADIIDVRIMMLLSGVLVLVPGLMALFLPGIGQPGAEWRRAVSLLRGVRAAPGLGLARAALPADFERLVGHVPALASLSSNDIRDLAAHALVSDAPAGAVVVRRGEASTAAFFIIEGRAVAGWDEEGGYRPLETLSPGDFFGEIAALTGAPRTANVVAEEPSVILQIPSTTLRQMMAKPELNRLFLSKMTERMVRMNMLDLPRFAGLDQQSLRELREAPLEPGIGIASNTPAGI
ncbi:MAG TPA: MFS transporter [Roseiflexaceae bacterium]|nr:MFS transporter [Roseiflexaceae bacterium]HMP38996.1 MFS transporter [Roseiflexaceae bacterium]